ncbi:hypothetical protein WKH56_20790 [Priestia sp. SB1]|uniref:hypothetical protein n=1 Tax=Priestia sp. SB1 TaxID=3132359 RepID=UPI00316FEE8F
MRKWNIETVNQFVNDNSQSKLLTTEYKNTKTLMNFECHCGTSYDTTFERFKLGKKQCLKCAQKEHVDSQRLGYDFVNKYISDSGCKLVSTEYVNTKSKLDIICHCGEPFKKSFEKFKKSKSCVACSYKKISDSQTFTYEEVKSFVENNSNCKLLSESYMSIELRLKFECECGNPFSTTFSSFKHSNQRYCKTCTKSQSKGEFIIESYLKNRNLKYEPQYKFDDLTAKNGRQKLRFDFAVLGDEITLIEFDGKQHFNPVEYFGGEPALKVLQYNDKLKNDYCSINGFKLIRIAYYDIENISDILEQHLIQ